MTPDTRLVYKGVVLFLVALLTGLLLAAAPPFVANPRGVLAGHLEGAMNGMFLMLVGLFIDRVKLSTTAMHLCRGTLLYSAYANWFFTTLAGVLGTAGSTPIAGAGHQGSATAELLISAGLVTVAVAALVGVGLLLAGLRRSMAAAPAIARV